MSRSNRAEDVPAEGRRGAEVDRLTIERCRNQDPVAFQAFVVRYERLVFAVLGQMLGHGPHVEDLAQEAFLRAYVAFPSFEPDGPRPSRWLLTIASRLAINVARTRRRVAPANLDDDDLPDALTPEIETARRELGRAIEDAIARLAPDMRAVFVLAELHDLTMAEIAAALGIPENTAKTRLFRAREHLRALLARRKGDHG
jgi:RNA polymerase sigma-70 factor (ECF subfamily)